MNKPIYATVPALPADIPNALSVEEPKKPGWPKGRPRGPQREQNWKKGLPRGTTRAEYDAMQAAAAAVEPERPACVGCARPTAPLSPEVMAELLRVARDRLSEQPEGGAADILYLAARVDGFCSLACWRAATKR